MPAVEAIRRYVDFTGRSTRTDFWGAVIIWFILSWCLSILDFYVFASGDVESYVSNFSPLSSIFFLLTIVPLISVSVRRLHDINLRGWWLLIMFTFVGIPMLFALMLMPTWPLTNVHGAVPGMEDLYGDAGPTYQPGDPWASQGDEPPRY